MPPPTRFNELISWQL